MDELRIYEVKRGKPFYMCLRGLVIVGYLPNGDETKTKFYVRMFLSQLLYLMTYLLICVHVVISIRNNTAMSLTFDITATACIGSFAISTCFFIIHRKKCLELCRDLLNFDEFGEPVGFKEILEKNYRSNISLIICSVANFFIFLITSLLNSADCERNNQQHGINDPCKYIAPYWIPFGNTAVPVYFGLFSQFVSAFAVHISMASIISWIFNSANLIVLHFDHLKLTLHSIFEESEPTEKRKKLKSWITYHNHILRMAAKMGKANQSLIGHLGIAMPICWALAGNNLLFEKSARMAYMFFGLAVSAFLTAHHGQLVVDASLSVQDEVYASKWYECDTKMMKDIQMILIRCQKPAVLSILPTGYLGYPLFLLIVRSTYSYLTVFSRKM